MASDFKLLLPDMAASESTAEEDVLAEVEAVQAVYGDDCCFLHKFPPRFHVHMKPRTAEISSQQFVELDFGIHASPQYPEEPPQIYIVESKGLDQQRQNDLMACIYNKAQQLSSCSMLLALCEEALECLSRMNHPEGNCPLCMYPLVEEEEDTENNSRPFMKLMSCFHCFHSECIIGWWNWVQKQRKSDDIDLSIGNLSEHVVTKLGIHEKEVKGTANCPVCRKIFHVKDIEHVLDLINANPNQEDGEEEMENVLQSESEKLRRQEFETILNWQEERDGLIKEKGNTVLLSGMFLTQQPSRESSSDGIERRGEENENASVGIEPSSNNTANNTASSNQPSSSRRGRYFHRGGRGRDGGFFHRGGRGRDGGERGRGRGKNPRPQAQIWLRKEK